MAKKLPLGLQDFRGIIEGGYKYIDKSKYLYQMASMGKYYFLSRPRRFGKSITVSMLHELYNGSRELFKGLWIEDKWDWSRKNPVIRISFKDVNFEQRGLEEPLAERISEVANNYSIGLRSLSARDRLRELIIALSERGKVVVLVDEYDAPIIHYLGQNINQSLENREYLRGFYSILKEMDAHLELVFLAGVSKSIKSGIFSGLNNLTDLTMHPQYATMSGYTQAELEHYFEEEITETAQQMNLTREALLEKLREWYNGYCFHHQSDRVYNPVSVNNFFDRRDFQNFWFATGTPTFLMNLLRQEGMYDLNFPPLNPGGFETFELDHLKPEAVLFQTGYLTIQHCDSDGLIHLDYPNKEVRDSMLENLIETFTGVHAERSTSLVISLRNAFFAADLEKVFRILESVFADIPYQLYEKRPEKFYHAAIHLLFTYMGLRVRSEVCTSDGRVDSLVETPDRIYLLEFKLDKTAREALDQILSRKYYRSAWERGKPVTCVGVNFSSETKNIESWVSEP
jgi:hypothetical protein